MALKDYEKATVVEAAGAIVRFLACKRCGAAVMSDPREIPGGCTLHDRWHKGLDGKAGR